MRDGFIAKSFLTPTSIASGFLLLALCKQLSLRLINSFDYELSNGIVEGTNNLIKQVKHNACGYRKFTHLKARIMLIKGIYNPLSA